MPTADAVPQPQQSPLTLRLIPIVPATMLDLERSAVLSLRVDYLRTRDQFTYGSNQWIRADGRVEAVDQILEMEGQ